MASALYNQPSEGSAASGGGGADGSGGGGSGSGSDTNGGDASQRAALLVIGVFALQLLVPCGTRLIVRDRSPLQVSSAAAEAAAAAESPAAATGAGGAAGGGGRASNRAATASRFAAREDLSPWQAIKTVDCWLLVWTDMICQGCNTALSNNLGQIVQSDGGGNSVRTLHEQTAVPLVFCRCILRLSLLGQQGCSQR